MSAQTVKPTSVIGMADEYPQSIDSESDRSVRLVCWEVWGGNARVTTGARLPGLEAVVYSLPCQGESGGDLYYLGACGSGVMGRICLADVFGHGSAVAEFSAWLHSVFRAHIHRISPAGVLRSVNKRAVKKGVSALSTAACFSYNSLNGKLRYCYAGHPRALVFRRETQHWDFLDLPGHASSEPRNTVFGMASDAEFDVACAQLEPGDRFVTYSDGVTELHHPSRGLLGAQGLIHVLERCSNLDASRTAHELLTALQAYAGKPELDHDYVTFMIFDVLPFQGKNRLYYFLRNNLRRLAGRVKR